MLDIVTYIAAVVTVYLIVVVPLNLMQGYAGLLSLSLAVSFGLGAYGAALAGQQLGASLVPALAAGAAVAMLAQLVMAYPSLGLGSLYFVVATLAFEFITLSVFDNWQAVTGGAAGLFGLAAPVLFGIDVSNGQTYLGVLLAVLAVNYALTVRLAHGSFGVKLRGVRDNAAAMQALGHDVRSVKVLVAVYYAGWAGIAGGLYANLLSIVSPNDFDINQSILLQAFVVVGGAGNIWAPLVAVPLLIGFPEAIRYTSIPDFVAGPVREALYGLLLIGLMRLRPEGLLPERVADAGPGWLSRGRSGVPLHRSRAPTAVELPSGQSLKPDKDGAVVLQATGVSIRFGGVRALSDVNFTVREGTVTALIGPNGAGKSTLLNVITGFLRAEAGEIRLRGQDIGRLKPHERVRAGVARSFQDLRSFDSLTTRQSVYLGVCARLSDAATIRAEVDRLVDAFGLDRIAAIRLGDLSYGDQKLVSIATLAATDCRMLILDEPIAGLDAGQIATVHSMLRHLSAEGRTICLVEHNMDFVRAAADHAFVLHQGAVILEGDPTTVLSHDRTLEVYLGL